MKLFLIFIFSSSLYAQISYTKSNKHLYLAASSCSLLEEEVKEVPGGKDLTCVCENDICKVDITSVLPKRMQKLLIQETTYLDTANCFNSVEYISNLTSILTNSDAKALNYHINSDLCEETTKPQFGDIVTIGDKDDLSHAFIYLTPNMSFTRNGGVDYQIQKTKNTLLEYGGYNSEPTDYSILSQLEDRCIGITKDEAVEKNCHSSVIYYRCKSFDKSADSLYPLRKKLDLILKKVNERTLNGKEYNSQIVDAQIMQILNEFETKLPNRLQEQLALNLPQAFDNLKQINYRSCSKNISKHIDSELNILNDRINILDKLLKSESLDSYKYFLNDIKQLRSQLEAYDQDYGSFIAWSTYGKDEYLVKYKNRPFTRPHSESYFDWLEDLKLVISDRKKALQKAKIELSDLSEDGYYLSLKEGKSSLKKATNLYKKFYQDEFERLKKEGRVFKKGYDGKDDYKNEDLIKMNPIR